MSALSDLPNIGKVLESYLSRVGIETPEQLRVVGTEETFIRIRSQIDPGACLRMLYGIQGAVDGIPDKFLSDSTKEELKLFYKAL